MIPAAIRISSRAQLLRALQCACICCLTCAGLGARAQADCGAPNVRFLESHPVADKSHGLTEPSGLTLSAEGTHLWTVSDNKENVILIDFAGQVRATHKISGEAEDLEGIAYDPSRHQVLVVSESAVEIVALDVETGASTSHPLSDMPGWNAIAQSFMTSDSNDLLEGIAVDAARERIYVLKEKRPRLLLELSLDLSKIRRHVVLTSARGIRDNDTGDSKLDVSGITVDGPTGCLWIVSDQGRRLFLYDVDAGSARSYGLDWLKDDKRKAVVHAEGIAHHSGSDRLYIINDDGKKSRLFVYAVERDAG